MRRIAASVVLMVMSLGIACGPSSSSTSAREPQKPSATTVDGHAWRRAKPESGQSASLAYPAPERRELANELRLYALRRPGQTMSLRVTVVHGAASVPAGKSGLAALTARMLTEGTRKRSSLELAEAAESLGSTLGWHAGRDESGVGLEVLKSDVDKALELLADVVTNPAFLPAEFERVRTEWLDGLVTERQDPSHLASLIGLFELNGRVRGAPVRGTPTDVERLSVKDLSGFHQRIYSPKKSALLIVGDLEVAALLPLVERHFGSWRSVAKPPPAVSEAAPAPEQTRVVIMDRRDAVQSALFAAQPFPKRATEGHEARELLTTVVGGLFTSRINLNLRERHGYTYGAFAHQVANKDWGAFVVSTNVKTEATADALRELIAELQTVKDPKSKRPITEDELGRARADRINSLGSHLEHTERAIADLETLFVHDLNPHYFTGYAERLRGIGKTELDLEAQKWLMPDKLIIAIVGDRSRIEKMLVDRGFAVRAAEPLE